MIGENTDSQPCKSRPPLTCITRFLGVLDARVSRTSELCETVEASETLDFAVGLYKLSDLSALCFRPSFTKPSRSSIVKPC